ncbi:hypothetical protein L207DRAFT_505133 [Hyaloscypha variabilis F]|uniref:Uncharacterized protein n=1 Tax=Hyaloscypha variabilis (strain UAMH 11265 / GT02V1 / F) TaxID=1149755 RepID=A0A2J6SBA8_HYAVF|nr:hypothetical protein L207DRAFT_505133 [Hyaloscypha variabilis F]
MQLEDPKLPPFTAPEDKESPPPYENPNELTVPPQSHAQNPQSDDNAFNERFDTDVESAFPKSNGNVVPPRRRTPQKKCCCWVW